MAAVLGGLLCREACGLEQTPHERREVRAGEVLARVQGEEREGGTVTARP